MDVSDLKGLFGEVKKRMDGHIEHVRRELGGVRTGRASVNILDTVHVEAYGSHMPLNQVATMSIPEPQMIIAGSGTDKVATWLIGILAPYASTCTPSSRLTVARPVRTDAISRRTRSMAPSMRVFTCANIPFRSLKSIGSS